MSQSDLWGTVSGAWGDVLVSLGYFKELVGQGNILYLGDKQTIMDFLSAQTFIQEIHQIPQSVVASTPMLWNEYWMRVVFEDPAKHPKDFSDLTPYLGAGIDPALIVPTHLTYAKMQPEQPAVQWIGASLPEESRAWAREFRKSLPPLFYILQPYSFNSNSMSRHWPHWKTLASHLAENTNASCVVVGHEWMPYVHRNFPRHPQLIDAVDKIHSMSHIFALAELSNGIITTSNSLAHWAQVQSLPCVVLCNTTSSRDDYMYRRVLEWPTLDVLYHDTSLEEALYALHKRLFTHV